MTVEEYEYILNYLFCGTVIVYIILKTIDLIFKKLKSYV